MTARQIVLDALNFYEIEVISVSGNCIRVQNNFEIEVGANRLYKLFNAGHMVAPFNDIDELCWFIQSF